jgi:hypothetical protein
MTIKETGVKPADEKNALAGLLNTPEVDAFDPDIENDLRISELGQQSQPSTNVPAVVAPGYFVTMYMPQNVASIAAKRNMKACIYNQKSRYDHGRLIIENQDDFPADEHNRLTYQGEIICLGLAKQLDVEAQDRIANKKRLVGGVQDQGRVVISKATSSEHRGTDGQT